MINIQLDPEDREHLPTKFPLYHKLPAVAKNFTETLIHAPPYMFEALCAAVTISGNRVRIIPDKVCVSGAGLPLLILFLAGYTGNELLQFMMTDQINFDDALNKKIAKVFVADKLLKRNAQKPLGHGNDLKDFADLIVELANTKLTERRETRLRLEKISKGMSTADADAYIEKLKHKAVLSKHSTFAELYNSPDCAGFDGVKRSDFTECTLLHLDSHTDEIVKQELNGRTPIELRVLIRSAMCLPPWTAPVTIEDVYDDNFEDAHFHVYPGCSHDLGKYVVDNKILSNFAHVLCSPIPSKFDLEPKVVKKMSKPILFTKMLYNNAYMRRRMYSTNTQTGGTVCNFHGDTIATLTM